jgi:hypothetical protein
MMLYESGDLLLRCRGRYNVDQYMAMVPFDDVTMTIHANDVPPVTAASSMYMKCICLHDVKSMI